MTVKSKPASTTKPGERSAISEPRRMYIRELLDRDRSKKVPFTEIFKDPRFPKVSNTVLYKDAEKLREDDYPIDTVNKHFVYNDERLRIVGRRSHERANEKMSIARIATKLIMPSEKDIAHFRVSEELRHKLEGLWRKPHRLLILDSGSTTAAVAMQIAKVKTPDGDRHLSHLRVLTNGDLVHRELNKAECKHGLIFLGGAERFDTGSIAGTLAERCLEAWGLQADIAVIGTTNVDNEGRWCCDHEDEANIKSRLLASARIRCLAVDSAKIINPKGGSSFPFADFSRFMIDIIITDPLIFQKHHSDDTRRLEFLRQVKERGIFIAAEEKLRNRLE